jgi:tetratricopeptide (TPR) repeat protein
MRQSLKSSSLNEKEYRRGWKTTVSFSEVCLISRAILLVFWIQSTVLSFGAPGPQPDSVDSLLRKTAQFKKTSASNALPAAEQALELARATGNTSGEVRALIEISGCYFNLGKGVQSEEYSSRAVEIARTSHDQKLLAEALLRRSKSLMPLNRYEEAVAGYLEASSLAEKSQDPVLNAVILDHLGVAHFVLRNFDKAMALSTQAKTVLDKSGDEPDRADCLEHLGIAYTGKKKWAEALDNFQATLALREKIGDQYTLLGTLGNIGLALSNLGRNQEALETLFRALQIAGRMPDAQGTPALQNRIGGVLVKLGRTEEAIAHYTEALQLNRQLGDKRRIAADLLALSEIYKEKHPDAAKSLQYLEEYVNLYRTIYSDELAGRVSQFQSRYDAEKREREIELLQKGNAIQELTIRRNALERNSSIAIVVLLVVILGLAWRKYQVEAKTSKALREALQKVNALQGLLPICSSCKNIRDDSGYWHQVETYIAQHSEAAFTHGICPSCAEKLYGEYYTKKRAGA